nr:methyl-accepting chemotaxis protein [uncultured Dethiosulfovibrio sp.]
MSLRVKMLLWVTVPVALVFLAVLGVVGTTVRGTSIDQLEDKVLATTFQYANQVQNDFLHLTQTAVKLRDVFIGLREAGATREHYHSLLKSTLDGDPFIFGLYTVWEPDKLDGDDDSNRDRPCHNEDGRYAPWVARSNGKAAIQPCTAEGGYLKPGGFYLSIKDSKKASIFPPSTWTFEGSKVTVVDYGIPIIHKGEFLGAMYSELEISGMREIVGNIKPLETGYASIMTDQGIYAASPEDEVLGKKSQNPYIDDIIKATYQGNPYSVTLDHTGGAMLHQYVPIFIEGVDRPWIFELVFPVEKAMAPIRKLTFTIAILAAVSLIFVVCLLWSISKRITDPIRKVAAIAQRAGEGDISAREGDFGNMPNDEVGDLARSLALMLEAQRSMIGKARDQSDRTTDKARSMADMGDRTAMAMEQIRGAVFQVVSDLETSSASLEQANAGIEEIAGGAVSVAERTTDGAEIAARTSDRAERSASHMSGLMDEVATAERMSRSSSSDMEQLGESVKSISSFVETITKIADQTNLLALNAAIEAARAGEAGRGFAVVAEEVRKLAEESSVAAGRIDGLIEGLKSQTVKSMEITRENATSMAKALSLAENTKQEMTESIKDIHNLNEAIQDIAAVAQEQAASSKEMALALDSVTSAVAQMAERVHSVKSSSDNTLRTAEEMASGSKGLLKDTEELKEDMDKFKL